MHPNNEYALKHVQYDNVMCMHVSNNILEYGEVYLCVYKAILTG